MGKDKAPGDSKRVGAVKRRSQVEDSITGTWTKREDKTGEFVSVEVNPKPFKGVRKRKAARKQKSSADTLEEIVTRLAPAMKRMADR